MKPPQGQQPDDQKNQRFEDGVEHDRPEDAQGSENDTRSMDNLGAVEGQGTAGADRDEDLEGDAKRK
jgi:hypothetical protein